MSIFLSITLVIALFPLSGSAQKAYGATIKSVSSASEFLSALSSATDGDIIDLGGNKIEIGAQSDGNDPIVNKAAITIQNGELSLRPAGIVQGADLTLKNLALTFQNSVRNGIFSNGYNTTLENVTKSASASYSVHVVMGPIFNPQSSAIPAKSTSTKPTLSISGKNSLGNIYMGVLDDIADDKGTAGYYNTLNPTVTIDTACESVFEDAATCAIYACGASEKSANTIIDVYEKSGNEMYPNADRLRVNSLSATINLGGSQVKSVYGNTGTGKHVIVNYFGGVYPSSNIILDSVGELNVKSGIFCVAPNTLSANSIIAGSSTALGVESGATLIAGGLGDVSVYNFNGGGTLSLGKNSDLKQKITITNQVSGTTNVVFGDSSGFWKTAEVDHVYLQAAKSSASSFTSTQGPTNASWVRNDSGEWLWSSTAVTHKHTYGFVDIDDNEHSYQCIDPGCDDETRDATLIEHYYADENSRVCEDCGHERIIIKDIFVEKDSSKLEIFKARVFNSLLHCKSSIDVSDIGLKDEEITYDNGQSTITGASALRSIIRTHSLFSTFCISGVDTPSFDYSADGTISTVNINYFTLWNLSLVNKFEIAYDDAMARVGSNYTEFQKAAVLYDWLCNYVNYGDISGGFDGVALGCFVNKRAICDGYAAAYKFLCEQAGLECYDVDGTTKVEKHAWNKVKIDGYWFWVDPTWDGSYDTNSHKFMFYNDSEWTTAGGGAHSADTDVSYAPVNTSAYFANKFWESKSGLLTDQELAQDPKLTVVCEHSWDAGVVSKSTTCTETGEKLYTCTLCKATRSESIAATGHKVEEIAGSAVAPTCVEGGKEADKICSICNDESTRVVGKTISALGHSFGSDGICVRDGCGQREPSPSETFKVTLSCPSTADVTLDKSEYKVGEQVVLTYRGKASGNNIYVIKNVKVDGIVVKSQSELLNKVSWQKNNSDYERRMKQSAKSVELASVVSAISTGSSIVIGGARETMSIDVEYEELTPVYRLYNMVTSEHLFTTDRAEYEKWVAKSSQDVDFWIGEGINWFAPNSSTSTVKRLYNPTLGEMGRTSHYYTSDDTEIENLTANYGWQDESIQGQVFASGGDIPIWTCYNEALGSAHHYTSSKTEWSGLAFHGWDLEETKNGATGAFSAALSAVDN